MGSDPDDSKRNSLLTSGQRELLKKPIDERTGASMRQKRRRFREQVEAGLTDFPLLFQGLSERDRDLLLGVVNTENNPIEPEERRPSNTEQQELYDALVSNLALIYEFTDRLEWDFERLMKDAAEEVYSSPKRSPDPRIVDHENVKVEIPTDPYDYPGKTYSRALQKFDRGEMMSLTDREIAALVKVGDLDAQRIISIYREQRREEVKEESREDMVVKASEMTRMFKGEGDNSGSDEAED